MQAACLVIVPKSDCPMDPSTSVFSVGQRVIRWRKNDVITSRFNSIRDVCKRSAWWLWQPRESQIARWIRWIHRTSVFSVGQKLSDGEKMTSSQANFNSIRDVRMRPAWWLPWPRESQIVRWIRWTHRTSVFSVGQGVIRWRKNDVMISRV